jgi:hypothetical protein
MSWPTLWPTQPPVQWVSGIPYVTVLHQKGGLKFRNESSKVPHLEHSFVWCWNLDTSQRISELLWKLWNVVMDKEGEDHLDVSCAKCSITLSQGGNKNQNAIKRRTGHILSSNYCIKHVIEGKVGQIEGTRRWERIRKQLLDDLKTRKHWELKEEATFRTVWRTRFARGYGPVVRQTPWWWMILCEDFLYWTSVKSIKKYGKYGYKLI